MARTFDTGLARPQRTLIRDGVVAILSGLLRANDGYLEAVVPFGGVVRSFQDEEGIDQLKRALNGRAPAILVGLGDRVNEAAGIGARQFKGAIELVLYFAANNLRGLAEGRLKSDARADANPTVDPGLEVMLEHAEELVVGQLVGGALVTNVVGEKSRATGSIKQIVLSREEELVTENNLTLWAQRYMVGVDRTFNRYRGVTELLEGIRTVARPSDVPSDVAPSEDTRPGERVLELENDTE